jgi:hypothetical protein
MRVKVCGRAYVWLSNVKLKILTVLRHSGLLLKQASKTSQPADSTILKKKNRCVPT